MKIPEPFLEIVKNILKNPYENAKKPQKPMQSRITKLETTYFLISKCTTLLTKMAQSYKDRHIAM
jgi:hypothetical protein